MNAYELADLVDERYAWIETKTLSNMLRQQADRIAELEKVIQDGIKAFGEMQEKQLKNKLGICISAEEYQKTHEGFSTIEEVIAKHEAIPSRKEAIDKAREWLKDYRIDAIVVEPFTKPLSDEEIIVMADSLSLIHYYDSDGEWSGITNEPMFRAEQNRNNEKLLEILKPFARAIEERHGIK